MKSVLLSLAAAILLCARVVAFAATTAQSQAPSGPGEPQFRELYKELVETNTTLSAGSCTLAAERMAARLRAVGFPDADLHQFAAPDHPKEGGLVASWARWREESAPSTGSAPARLEQEPGAPLGLVDPVLDQAGGRDIAQLIDQVVDLAQPPSQ